MKGVIETATGDLLRWRRGTLTFTLDAGESAAPEPLPAAPKRRYQKGETQMHRWNSGTSSYDLVTNPTKPDLEISRTISGGTITIPTGKRKMFAVIVDVESGTSDNLDAILGGAIGTIVILRITSNARTVTVRDNQAVGSDKIEAAGNFILNQIKDKMMLVRRNDNTWDELTRSPN